MQKKLNQIINEIKKHENTVIMSHKNADLDALASSVCLFQIIKSLNKDCFIYLDVDAKNPSIEKALYYLNRYNKTIYFTRTLNKKIINPETLLIIVDTQVPDLLENEEVLEICNDVIIIDHHSTNKRYISKAKIEHIDSTKSSVVEIMINYLKELNLKPDSLISTIMLAGMEIDTNSFDTKTTAETYEAAAFLAKNKANQILKRKIKKESREAYLKRNELIKKSFMITKDVAICALDNKVYYRSDLAEISEDLLTLDKVEAAFTIGRTETNKVSISARSLGNYDVKKIMIELGGGGHKNEAATQITGSTMEEVKNKLIELIKR